MYSAVYSQCSVQARAVLGVAHPNGGTQLTGPGGQHSVCQKQKITSATYKYNTGCWSESEHCTRVMSCCCDNEIISVWVWTARALVLHNWLPWPLLLAAAAGFVIAAPRMGPCPHLRYTLHILKTKLHPTFTKWFNYIDLELMVTRPPEAHLGAWWRTSGIMVPAKISYFFFQREKSPVMDS